MNGTAQQRAMALLRVMSGEWTAAEAAVSLALSERQVRRLMRAYAEGGPAALVHGNQGRKPAHALAEEVRAQVVDLARGKYAGFNDRHLTEKLAELEALTLGRTTVRAILRGAGIASPRTRRAPKHRRRRERMGQEGLLLQADGSRHRWLGKEGPYLTLVGGIDDATGVVPWALFREQEDAAGYMQWLWVVVERHGIPQALYVDRHGIFERRAREPRTVAEDLAGGRQPTQFGRVLGELGITHIAARSPQAKGRVERLWGTFQDRLGSELRLAGAQTLADANRVLWDWLPSFNARFAVPAAQPGSAYRPLPDGFVGARIFCFKYPRTVAADNTVQFGPHRLQLQPSRTRLSFARARVEVQERLDGSLAVAYQGAELLATSAPAEAPLLRARKQRPSQPPPAPLPATAPAARPPSHPAAATGRPPPTHPWRRSASVARTQSRDR